MKNTRKGFVIPLIIAIVALLGIGGGVYLYINNQSVKNVDEVNENVTNIVGNDRDEHGCIGSAGYSWCEAKNKCLRIWEESCEVAPAAPVAPIACTMDAMLCPDGSYVGRSGPKCEFICPTINKAKMFLQQLQKELGTNMQIISASNNLYINNELEGGGYKMFEGYLIENIPEVSNYNFRAKGFNTDIDNSGDATFKGTMAYKNEDITCLVKSAIINFYDGMPKEEMISKTSVFCTEHNNPPLGKSTLKINCDVKSCNTSGVNFTRSDFYITSNGKKIKVLIDIETRLRQVLSDFEKGVLTETEVLKKWAEFYPLLEPKNTVGMPYSFTATIYGDWIDNNTFRANWIKWGPIGY